MTTIATNTEIEKITTGLQSFDTRKATLTKLAEEAKGLTLTSVDDKEAYKLVTAKRKELKNERVAIQKEGKSMRDLITPISKMISEKEKELVVIIGPEEERLQNLETWFENEVAKIKAEEERKEREKIQKRIDELAKYNVAVDYEILITLTDDQFNSKLEKSKEEFEAEQQRIESERLAAEKLKKEEEEKIRADREEIEKVKREQAEQAEALRIEREKIDSEKKAIQAEKDRVELAEKQKADAIKKEAEMESARKEAAKQALIDQKNKEAAKALTEQKRLAKLPDVEKAEKVIKSLSISFGPDVTINTPELNQLCIDYVEQADGMMKAFLEKLESLKK